MRENSFCSCVVCVHAFTRDFSTRKGREYFRLSVLQNDFFSIMKYDSQFFVWLLERIFYSMYTTFPFLPPVYNGFLDCLPSAFRQISSDRTLSAGPNQTRREAIGARVQTS